MRKKIIALLLGCCLAAPLALQAKPVLIINDLGPCFYAWAVYDTSDGSFIGGGTYMVQNCGYARANAIQPNSEPVFDMAVIDQIKVDAAKKSKISEAAVADMPVLMSGIEEVEPVDELPKEIKDQLGAGYSIGTTYQGLKFDRSNSCFVTECLVYPVPVETSFTLKFNCSADHALTKPLSIKAYAADNPAVGIDIKSGTLTDGSNTVDVDASNLKPGRYALRVSVGAYSRIFDILKNG